MTEPYTVIIGLEVHVQLLTRTKLFCRCSTKFGAPPNTQTCPVCIGMPGTLPVMNREAFRLGLKTAVALNCQIAPFTKWDRKQYYYPDLPKGYQISQYDSPFSHDGWLEISDPKGRFEAKKIGIIRAHLEEDAGKSMHDEVAAQADSRIDLNRAGTPLLEIVSQPDLRSAAEAKAYLAEMKLLLTYLGVSDCNMQEGSLRVDANINLHVETPDGEVATPIVEVKNMNSFRAVERAMEYEARRQYQVWQETGQKLGDVPKQTRGWDDTADVTRGQRHKEESSDYRYLPDPDLVPVRVSAAEIEAARQSLGELPALLRQRLERTYGIKPYDSDVLVSAGRPLVDYYVRLAELCGDGKLASNWVQQDVMRTLNEQKIEIEKFSLQPETLVELLRAIQEGQINTSRAREVFIEMVNSGKSAAQVMKAQGIEKVDESELVALCQELIDANPKIVADIRSGKQQAAGNLIGQAKKKNPNVNPGRFREIVIELVTKPKGKIWIDLIGVGATSQYCEAEFHDVDGQEPTFKATLESSDSVLINRLLQGRDELWDQPTSGEFDDGSRFEAHIATANMRFDFSGTFTIEGVLRSQKTWPKEPPTGGPAKWVFRLTNIRFWLADERTTTPPREGSTVQFPEFTSDSIDFEFGERNWRLTDIYVKEWSKLGEGAIWKPIVSGNLTTPFLDGDSDEIMTTLVPNICSVLSFAFGRSVNWISYELQTGADQPVHRSRQNAWAAPFKKHRYAPVDNYEIGTLKELIKCASRAMSTDMRWYKRTLDLFWSANLSDFLDAPTMILHSLVDRISSRVVTDNPSSEIDPNLPARVKNQEFVARLHETLRELSPDNWTKGHTDAVVTEINRWNQMPSFAKKVERACRLLRLSKPPITIVKLRHPSLHEAELANDDQGIVEHWLELDWLALTMILRLLGYEGIFYHPKLKDKFHPLREFMTTGDI